MYVYSLLFTFHDTSCILSYSVIFHSTRSSPNKIGPTNPYLIDFDMVNVIPDLLLSRSVRLRTFFLKSVSLVDTGSHSYSKNTGVISVVHLHRLPSPISPFLLQPPHRPVSYRPRIFSSNSRTDPGATPPFVILNHSVQKVKNSHVRPTTYLLSDNYVVVTFRPLFIRYVTRSPL